MRSSTVADVMARSWTEALATRASSNALPSATAEVVISTAEAVISTAEAVISTAEAVISMAEAVSIFAAEAVCSTHGASVLTGDADSAAETPAELGDLAAAAAAGNAHGTAFALFLCLAITAARSASMPGAMEWDGPVA